MAYKDADLIKTDILFRLGDGESLRKICKSDGMPAHPTVMLWVKNDPEFAKAYEEAQELRADVYFDELDNVSDLAVKSENAGIVAGLKLKSENIRWKLSRMSQRYSDKVVQQHSGSIDLVSKEQRDAAVRAAANADT